MLGLNGEHIRGDEFPSMAVAKQKAASSPSAFILHYIWMRNVAKRETIRALDDLSCSSSGSIFRVRVYEIVRCFITQMNLLARFQEQSALFQLVLPTFYLCNE